MTWNTDRTVSRVVGRLVVMDNEKMMTVWCRMWSEGPALAHDVMTDGCVQWSSRTEGLDAVVGPHEQERFVTAYRAEHVNVFTPRVLADAGDRFAYLWDVRTAEGRVLTGLDANVLRDGRVLENWTFVAERHDDVPDLPVGPVDPAEVEELCDRWVRLRSGRTDLAADLVTDDFTLFCGTSTAGDARGPAELAERQAVPLTIHRTLFVDPARGHAAFLWTTESGAASGADFLAVRDGRIARAWSLAGVRSYLY